MPDNPKDGIAFIGLGTMGEPMVRQLALAAFKPALFDLNGEAAARIAQDIGGTLAPTANEAARGADIVITMLPSSKEVDATVLGADGKSGVFSVLAKGAIVIDMSSSDPMRTRDLAGVAAGSGITFVDAPVSGAVRRARDGSLSIMFGGDAAALERVRPVLAAMGKQILHVGAVGAGHAMKALNNYVSAAGLVAAVEALHVGEKFGIDPAVMTQVFNASTGKNNTTEHKVAQFMLSGTYASGFFLGLMAKDVGIAIGLADQLGVRADLGQVCAKQWKDAAAKSERTADHTEMYRILEP